MKAADVAWMAGLMEGEGSFGFYREQPRVWIGMTDEDVIDRLRKLLRIGAKVHRAKANPLSTKPCFVLSFGGRRAAGFMMTVLPLMGRRRAAKIKEVLAAWRARPYNGKRPGPTPKPFEE